MNGHVSTAKLIGNILTFGLLTLFVEGDSGSKIYFK